jgi:D-lactate dehydrogenase
MHGKTVGVIRTGQIGTLVTQILTGFGSPTLSFDPFPNTTCRSLGVRYVELNELFAESDIISFHCPLTPENRYMIRDTSIAKMKKGVMLINTSRGGLLDTVAIIEELKSGKIGYLGLDVYEEEEEMFFEDRYCRCYSATGHLLGFALQKLRGSLRRIPATVAVSSKTFL